MTYSVRFPYRVNSTRLSLWCTSRLYWSLAAIAMLLACSPGVAFFVPIAEVAATVLLIALAVDALVGPKSDAIVARRSLPQHFTLGKTATVSYTIQNHSRMAIRCGIIEGPLKTLRDTDPETVVELPARSQSSFEKRFAAISRGTDAFTTMFVWCDNPLGLLRRRFRVEDSAAFRVFPDLSAVERYGALRVRNHLLEAGLRRMRLRGAGSEFESLREYTGGDAFREIDWKATARRGKPMVIQRQVERSQDVMLLLDCGRLMTPRLGAQRKLDYAITAALSLASIAALAHDRVGVAAFAKTMLSARAPRSTAASLYALTNAVCDLEPRFEESDYSNAVTFLRAQLQRRSLIVLFTDVVDPLAQSTVLAELGSLAKRHVILCVLMNDAAVATTLSLTPDRIDEAYQMDVALGLAQERTQAANALRRAGIDVLDVPAARIAAATIDEYLRIKERRLL